MNGLIANTAYTYAVGEGPTGPWSETFTFTSPDFGPNASFGVSIYGDMGWLGSAQRPDRVNTGGVCAFVGSHVAECLATRLFYGLSLAADHTRDIMSPCNDLVACDETLHIICLNPCDCTL